MIEKWDGLIKELDVEVLQCEEGIDKLSSFSTSESPYIINAMLWAVGARAAACSLKDYTVHKHAPDTDQDVCIIHCGEENCAASLEFMNNSKADMTDHCGKIIYLQG